MPRAANASANSRTLRCAHIDSYPKGLQMTTPSLDSSGLAGSCNHANSRPSPDLKYKGRATPLRVARYESVGALAFIIADSMRRAGDRSSRHTVLMAREDYFGARL